MDKANLIMLFQSTLSCETATRESAEKQLQQMKKIAGFPSLLLEIVKTSDDPSLPVPLRQSAAVYLKNLAQNHYQIKPDEASHFTIHENDKACLRENILPAVVVTPDQIRSILAVVINQMIKGDYATGKWRNSLNQEILVYIQSEKSTPHMWLAGLMALFQLTKVFEYKKEGDRSILLESMKTFLPLLLDVCNKLLEDNSSNAALLQKYVLKIFFALSQYTLPVDLFSVDSMSDWIKVFTKVLESPVPADVDELDNEEKAEVPHWKVKKWALHIINRLFERFGSPGAVEDNYEQFAQFFLAKAAVPLLTAQLEILAKKREGQWIAPRVVQLILSFCEHSISHAQTWSLLKGSNYKQLLKDILFPLMCFQEEDAELWEEDPEEYIRLKFDIFAELTDPKSAAESFVSQACTKRKIVLTDTMNFIQELLGSLSTLKPEQVDGVFNLICSVSEQLMKKKQYKNQIDSLIKTFFIPLCSAPQGYLRARGLNAIKTFAEANVKKTTIKQAFQVALKSLTNESEDLPVSVEAAMALSTLASENQEKADEFMKKNIAQVLRSVLTLINKTVNDDLSDVIKKFITDFREYVEPIAVELAEGICQSFIALATGDDGDEGDEADNKALTAVGVLTALDTLLDMVEDNETLVTSVEEIVSRVIAWTFQHKKMDFYEEVLSLLSSITTHHVSADIWPALGLLNEILRAGEDGGVEFFVDMMPALHNFVTVASATFFGDENNLQILFNMIKFVLDSEDSGEDAETHALKLLEVLIFQAANRIPGVISNAVALSYERGFSGNAREIKTSELRTMSLQVILAALFVDESPDTMNFLNERNWLHSGLNQWLDDFDCIFGIHDRRLSLLMMAKFLQMQDQPLAIKENSSQILPKCLLLFKGLERAYEVRAEQETTEGSEVDSDDSDASFDMDQDSEDDVHARGDIDQLNDDEDDVDEDGKNYLEMLKNYKVMDEFEEEGETALEDYTTIIDEDGIPFEGAKKDPKTERVIQHSIPDEYQVFTNVLQQLQTSNNQFFAILMGSLLDEQQKELLTIGEQAKRRFESHKSKEIEKQGGFKFNAAAQVPTTFNFSGN